MGDLSQQHRWVSWRHRWHHPQFHRAILVQLHDICSLSHCWLLALCCGDQWLDACRWSYVCWDFHWTTSSPHICLLCCDLRVLHYNKGRSRVEEVLSYKGHTICSVHSFNKLGISYWCRYVNVLRLSNSRICHATIHVHCQSVNNLPIGVLNN